MNLQETKDFYRKRELERRAKKEEYFAEAKAMEKALLNEAHRERYANDTEFRERQKAYCNNWRENNKEKQKADIYKWRENNREKYNEYSRYWMKKKRANLTEEERLKRNARQREYTKRKKLAAKKDET